MRRPGSSRTGRVLGALLTLVVAGTFVLTVDGNEETAPSTTLVESRSWPASADTAEPYPCGPDTRRSDFVTAPCPQVHLQARIDADSREH